MVKNSFSIFHIFACIYCSISWQLKYHGLGILTQIVCLCMGWYKECTQNNTFCSDWWHSFQHHWSGHSTFMPKNGMQLYQPLSSPLLSQLFSLSLRDSKIVYNEVEPFSVFIEYPMYDINCHLCLQVKQVIRFCSASWMNSLWSDYWKILIFFFMLKCFYGNTCTCICYYASYSRKYISVLFPKYSII